MDERGDSEGEKNARLGGQQNAAVIIQQGHLPCDRLYDWVVLVQISTLFPSSHQKE